MGAFGVGHGCCGGRERFVVVGRCEQRKYQGGGANLSTFVVDQCFLPTVLNPGEREEREETFESE